ncbi:MAG TPA: GGDEF domain-containing phosphodiesterase [Longimicrobiales bacterium]
MAENRTGVPCPECGRGDPIGSHPRVADPVVLGHVLRHMAAIAKRYGRNVGVLHVHADGLAGVRLVHRDPTTQHAAELRVVKRLRNCVRDSDLVARLGYGRYALALGDLWEPEMIARVANRVMAAFARPLWVRGVARACPVRVGIALWPHDAAQITDLLRVAEAAGDRLAGTGPGVAYDDPELAAYALRQTDIEGGLRGSPRELFELHYQPIFSLTTGEPVGAEALARWNRPGAGQVSAGQFIDLAERTGRIASLDRWAIGEVTRQVAAWRRAGWTGWVSVNLSGRTLDTADLPAHFESAIERADADPRQLLVEVTETAAMRDRGRSMDALRELRALGLQLAVDDFGAGHASVSYLRDFNPDLVKLDKSFLHGLDGDRRNDRIMEGLILMAHHLGKPIVAEGCERDEQRKWLIDAGCDLVQGYFTGRPSDAATFQARWIDDSPAARDLNA